MKLTHVFGLVAAVHASVFTVIFATPGCRSTGKQNPRPEQTDPVSAGVVAMPVDEFAGAPVESMSFDDLNAGAPTNNYTSVSPVAPDGAIYDGAAGGGIRYAPTRPGTGPAAALAPGAAPSAATSLHTVVKGDNLWTLSRKFDISVAELAAANRLSRSATLRIGQTLTVPSAAASTSSIAASAGEAVNTYLVVSGDTLGSIARKQGTTVAALRTANNLSGDMLRVGQQLVLPGGAVPLSPSAAAASTPSPTRAGSANYTVVPGDTLGAIAQRSGVRVGDLALLNNITDPAKLRVGQVLKLPAGATAPRASAPAARAATPATPAPARATPAPVAPASITPIEQTEPTGVSPVEPVQPVEPIAIPVIRIDDL